MDQTDPVFPENRSLPLGKIGAGGGTSQAGLYLLAMRKTFVKILNFILALSLFVSSCVIAKSRGENDSRITMYRVWETDWTFMKGDVYTTHNRLLIDTGRMDVHYNTMKINGETVIIQFVVEENNNGILP